MSDLWTVLAPILITDALNPTLLAAIVFTLGAAQPFRTSSMVLIGHTMTYLVGGMMLVALLDPIVEFILHPEPWHYFVSGLIGCVLIGCFVQTLRAPQKPADRLDSGTSELGFVQAFNLGAVVSVTGLPFAVPYIAALDRILRTELTTSSAAFVLIAYNLLYALPFALMILASAHYGKESRTLLQKLKLWVEKAAEVVFPVLLLVVGMFFVIDSGLFFYHGKGLF